jgi:hypothetical protein
MQYIVTWRLKAGKAESQWKSVASQRLAEHIPAAENKPIASQQFGKHVSVGTNIFHGYP